MTTKGTGYLPGMDLNDYWQEVWAEKAANSSISRKPALTNLILKKYCYLKLGKLYHFQKINQL